MPQSVPSTVRNADVLPESKMRMGKTEEQNVPSVCQSSRTGILGSARSVF